MGALSDVFAGRDPTTNMINRQTQMVAMEEKAKEQRAIQNLRNNIPLSQADLIDLLGAKDYITATTNKGSTLMQNTQYITDLYTARDNLPENDPQREQYNIAIRNAEAGIGAYKYDPTRQFDLSLIHISEPTRPERSG